MANLNCNAKSPLQQNKVEDDDSVISEECWEELYRGDSRKWMMRQKNTEMTKVTTMKESYQVPVKDKPIVARRRELIHDQLFKEAVAEIENEFNQPPEIAEYMTTYDTLFKSPVPGYDAYKIKRSPELYDKFPLYASTAMSFWKCKFDKRYGNNAHNEKTEIADLKQPFRKNSSFSKPLSESYEDQI